MKRKNLLIIIGILLLILVIGIVLAVVLIKKEDGNTEEVEKITIKFETDGGEPVEDITIEKNEKVTLPTTVKDGFNFLGWYKDDEKMEEEVKFKKDVTLTAKWEEIPKEAKKMEVSFNTNGGSAVKSFTMECEKPITFPAPPTKAGYVFSGWTDKKGKDITKGDVLACANITLYAKWKAEEKKEEKKEEPKKEYTCPEGYTLDGTKCTQTVAAKEKCPDGTKVDGSLCIRTSDYNSGTRVCQTRTVQTTASHTETVQGEYYQLPGGPGYCGYYVYKSLTTQTECESAYDKNTVWANNKCYAKTIINDYTTSCDSGYEWYTSEQLSSKFGIHDNGKCLKKEDKVKYCESGYTLNVANCVKTIDATEK